MMYEHYFQSDASKVVSHKPVNLEISTLAAGLKRKFTLAVKTSEDKIKRRLNKTSPITEVYLTSENDPLYQERAQAYARAQAAQAAAAQEAEQASASPTPGATSSTQTKAQQQHRTDAMNYIGSKEIFTSHPGGGIVCIKLRAAEETLPMKRMDKSNDGSHDGFLYSVETKGGKSLGRQKQRYILLKRSCIYSLLLPSDILVTKIETKDKHGEITVMKHWISSSAQLVQSQQVTQALVGNNLVNKFSGGGTPMSTGVSPANVLTTNGLPHLPTVNAFSHMHGMNQYQQHQMNGVMNAMNMGMNLSNLSPFHMSMASISTNSSPARSMISPAAASIANLAHATIGMNNGPLALSPRGFNFQHPGANSPFMKAQPQNQPLTHFSPSGNISGLGLTFPSPTNQIMQNLNLMLPSSQHGSPNNFQSMMLLSNGSLSNGRVGGGTNSGTNSVSMTPNNMLSPAGVIQGSYSSAIDGHMNAQAIQQQIARLQSMLAQQNGASGKTPNNASTNGKTGSPNSAFAQQQLNGHQQQNKPNFPPFHPPPVDRPNSLGILGFSPANYMTYNAGDSNMTPSNSSTQQQAQTPSNGPSSSVPPMSPFSPNTSGTDGSQSAYTIIKDEPEFPSSPVLPGNMRIRDRSNNNGLYHSFDSHPDTNSVAPSVHSSLSSLPTDTTRENSSAESSAANSLRSSADHLAHGLAGQNFFSRPGTSGGSGGNSRPPSFAHYQQQPQQQQSQQQQQPQQQFMMREPEKSVSSSPSSEISSHQMMLDQTQAAGAISSAYWNPPNPNPPQPSQHINNPPLPGVNSPDFLCTDLFQPGQHGLHPSGSIPANFFASPQIDSGSSGESANSSPIIPNGIHSSTSHRHDNHKQRYSSLPSSATLSAALKAPTNVPGLNNSMLLSPPEPNRPSSSNSHRSNTSASTRTNHKRKKTTTKKKKRGHNGSQGERKMYSLSPKLWNLQVKKPPFRTTLTIGKHTDKFKSSDQIQIRIAGTFLDPSHIDQYKKHLIIDMPPPPNPAALMGANVDPNSIDLSRTNIEAEFELHLNGNRVFLTVFTYKFGGASQELTSSSDSDDTDSDSGSGSGDDSDSMNDDQHSGRHSGGSSGGSNGGRSPDHDDRGGDNNSKRHKPWNGHDMNGGNGINGYGRSHSSGIPQPAIRLSANFESIPLFSTGVLKAYPLLNAGLQDLLQNYLLNGCLAKANTEAPAEQTSNTNSPPRTKKYSVGGKTPTPGSSRCSSRADQRASSRADSPCSGSSGSDEDQSGLPTNSPNRQVRVNVGSAHTSARVQARMLFVQALTSPNPLIFIHTALRSFIEVATAGVEQIKSIGLPVAHTHINAHDSFGFTLLHYTVSVGDVALTELLLSFGADAALKARNKHSKYAFTPMQLVQLRQGEDEEHMRKQARSASVEPLLRPGSRMADTSANGKKKRRTENDAEASSSEDSTMGGDTAPTSTEPSPLLANAIPFSSHFTSGHTSITNSPTAQTRSLTMTSKDSKNFSFSPTPLEKDPMKVFDLQHLQQQEVQVYHMQHTIPNGMRQTSLNEKISDMVSPTATTAAPTPHSLLSSPVYHSHQMVDTSSYGIGHVSIPNTPMNKSVTITEVRFRHISDPHEINQQLNSLFKQHVSSNLNSSDSSATTSSAASSASSEMSDHSDQPASSNSHNSSGSGSSSESTTTATAGLLHISAKFESYLETRWHEVNQKKLNLIATVASISTGFASLTPEQQFAVSEEERTIQRELVMLELAMLIQHAQKQMNQLDLDLPEKHQSLPLVDTNKLSSPVQSLHIHTLRSLLSQFHLLLKYYESYQKHKFEKEQMNNLVDEIDQVGLTLANETDQTTATNEPMKDTANQDLTSSANDQALVGVSDHSDLHDPSLSDTSIYALFIHVSNIELQLRAHILHMQQCLEPYITRALALRKQQEQELEQQKIELTAAVVASAVNVNYGTQSSSTSTSASSNHLPTPLTSGHLSRRTSGQLSLNIVGSINPDVPDEHQRIEVREIHGVDVLNQRRIDLTFNPTLLAEETQAEVERNILRRLHEQKHVYEPPPLEKIAEKVAADVSSMDESSNSHAPVVKRNPSLVAVPFPTPTTSPNMATYHYYHQQPTSATNASVVAVGAAAGKTATEAALASNSVDAITSNGQPNMAGISAGNKYALLIGINQYSPSLQIPTLLGCENDVARIGSIIHEKYGFDLAQCRAVDDGSEILFQPGYRTQALLNMGATRLTIRKALISLVSSITSSADSVLIYFAGHGFHECFIAYDGMLDYSEITFLLEGIATRDVSFVSDTCAGTNMDMAQQQPTSQVQVKNTTLTLAEMRQLVDNRDLLSQQQAAAEILATISPNAPAVQVTQPTTNSSNTSLTGYEGDESTIDHMDSSDSSCDSGDVEAESYSESDADEDDSNHQGEEVESLSDADQPMDEDDTPMTNVKPTKTSYRGLAFMKVEPAEPTSQPCTVSLTDSDSTQPSVIPVISRLFGHGKKRGKGYFARGLVSRDDPRASEIQGPDGKWMGTYTARLCEKLEKFAFNSDDTTRPSEPANPTVITLAHILFHDEDGGNLSGRSETSSSAGSSRKSSLGGENSPRYAAMKAAALEHELMLIGSHQTDEIDPELNCADHDDSDGDDQMLENDSFGFELIDDEIQQDGTNSSSESEDEIDSPDINQASVEGEEPGHILSSVEEEGEADETVDEDVDQTDSHLIVLEPEVPAFSLFTFLITILTMLLLTPFRVFRSPNISSTPVIVTTATAAVTSTLPKIEATRFDSPISMSSPPISPSPNSHAWSPTADLLTTDTSASDSSSELLSGRISSSDTEGHRYSPHQFHHKRASIARSLNFMPREW